MTPVYVHIPYCRSKCPYCDFASEPIDDSVPSYLHALSMEAIGGSNSVKKAKTVYVGGGTPSILTPDQISEIFDHLWEVFEPAPQAEVTIEANPCLIDAAKVDAMLTSGVNRVSLGGQSFNDNDLSVLGRSHKARDISPSVSILRDAGIENLSLDLIYAVPNQTLESWRHSLERALELLPDHISAYCLTFEEGTPFWQSLQEGRINKKSDEEELEFYELAREMLTNAGYEHYEISNFAMPGKRSVHNMAYWANEEYLGLGAGAVSYLDGKRISNVREASKYIEAAKARKTPVAEVEDIPLQMQAVETVIQGLRTSDGINCTTFVDRFGIHPKDVFGDSLNQLIDLELLVLESDTMCSSVEGWRLANEVALKALP